MKDTTKTFLKYLGAATLRACFIVFGYSNFMKFTSTSDMDSAALYSLFFLVLDIYLVFYWNSVARGLLKEYVDLKKITKTEV